MAVAGRKPKPEDQRRNRHAPTHQWTEVPDVPHEGAPALPDRPPFVHPKYGVVLAESWPPATERWWRVISRMPHCVLWTEADWQYAMDTAEVHARWTLGLTGATELRIREKRLGNTLDARRDLRIRYVAPPTEQAPGEPGEVVQLDQYRDLYG